MHAIDESTSSMNYIQLINFIHSATSPETAQTYMKKMNYSDKNDSTQSSGSKRKLQLSSATHMTIEPILVELQALLSIPHLRSAIRLVQTLDSQPNISPQDKTRGWFQLLDFFHQKEMLLDESKNSKFHSLTVGSNTGLDSILSFFQGIVRQVMDAVEKSTEERRTAITVEEENWIRCTQMQVRKTVLTFCMRRAAFSSDLGSGALTVACDVSGLQLEADGYFGAIGDQVALSRRMDDILMADIEVPVVPLPLVGPGREFDNDYLLEQDAVDVQDNSTEEENEGDIQYLDIAADTGKEHPSRDEIVPPSPANVPFVVEDIDEDYEEDLDAQESETDEDLKIVVESDDIDGNNDDAIILEESDDQVANQNRVDPAYVDSDDEEDFTNSEDQSVEDQNAYEMAGPDSEDQFVEDQNGYEMAGPDYVDSEDEFVEDEFVEDQNECMVNQEDINSEDEFVEDQNANEVAGPEYVNSEDEIVEDQDARAVDQEYADSDEDIIIGERAHPEYVDSEDDFVDDQDARVVDQEYTDSEDEIIEDQHARPEYVDSEDEFVDDQNARVVDQGYADSEDEIVEEQHAAGPEYVDGEDEYSEDEIVEDQDTHDAAGPDYTISEEEEDAREEDAHEVDQEHFNSEDKVVDNQHANEAASPKYTSSEEEEDTREQDSHRVGPEYVSNKDKCVDDQPANEATGPECTSSEDEYFNDQDTHEVNQGYVDSKDAIVRARRADVAEGAKDVIIKANEDDNDQDARVDQEYSDSEDEIVEDQHASKAEDEFVRDRDANETASSKDVNSEEDDFIFRDQDARILDQEYPTSQIKDVVEDQDANASIGPKDSTSEEDIQAQHVRGEGQDYGSNDDGDQSVIQKAGDKVLEIGSYESASDARNSDSASDCYDSAANYDSVDQVHRGMIQIESSEEEECHSEHSDLRKSSDDMADADDTVDDGNSSANQGLDLGYGNRQLSFPPARCPRTHLPLSSHIVQAVMTNQRVQLNDAAVESDNHYADADAQDDISMDETDNSQTSIAQSYASKILKAPAVILGANRPLAGDEEDEEDEGNAAGIENIVETEDEKQGKTETSSPFNEQQSLAAQEEEDENDAGIETIVQTEDERQDLKEKASHSDDKQSNPNAVIGLEATAHDASKGLIESMDKKNEDNDREKNQEATMKGDITTSLCTSAFGDSHQDAFCIKDINFASDNGEPNGPGEAGDVNCPVIVEPRLEKALDNSTLHSDRHGIETVFDEDALLADKSSSVHEKNADLDTSQSIEIEEEREEFSYASKDKVVEDTPGVDTQEDIDNERIGGVADKSHINIKGGEHGALPHEGEMDDGGNSEATEDMDVAVPETQEPTTQESNTNNREAEYSSGAETDVKEIIESPKNAAILKMSGGLQDAATQLQSPSDNSLISKQVEICSENAACALDEETKDASPVYYELHNHDNARVVSALNPCENEVIDGKVESDNEESTSGPDDNVLLTDVKDKKNADVGKKDESNSLLGTKSKFENSVPLIQRAGNFTTKGDKEETKGVTEMMEAIRDDSNSEMCAHATGISNRGNPVVVEQNVDRAPDNGATSSHDDGSDSDDSAPTEELILQEDPEQSDNFSEPTYRELQKLCKERDKSARGSTEVLKQRLREAVDVAKSSKDQKMESVPEEHVLKVKAAVAQEDENDDGEINVDYSQYTCNELRKVCVDNRLSTNGKKEELQQRILEAKEAASNAHEQTEDVDTKSNQGDNDTIDDDLSTPSYRDLQKMCKDRGLKAGGKRDVLVNLLRGESLAGDVSEAIQEKEEDSSSWSDNGKIETEEQIMNKIVGNAIIDGKTITIEGSDEDNEKKAQPPSPVPSSKDTTTPKQGLFRSLVGKVQRVFSPEASKKQKHEMKKDQEIISIQDSEGDTSGDDADSVATPNVPSNIDLQAPNSCAMSVLSPGDQSIMSTFTTHVKATVKPSPHQTRKRTRKVAEGLPPKPINSKKKAKREDERSAKEVSKPAATRASSRSAKSKPSVRSTRSTRSTRSRSSKK